MMKPLLFLDVDGVMNVHAARVPVDYMHITDLGYDLPVSIPGGIGTNIDLLNQVYEIIWCTAWFSGANGFNDLWRIPHFEVLKWGAMKLPAIVDRARGLPWAFIDDDIEFELQNFQAESLDNAMLINVDARVGLTHEQTGQALKYAHNFVPCPTTDGDKNCGHKYCPFCGQDNK